MLGRFYKSQEYKPRPSLQLTKWINAAGGALGALSTLRSSPTFCRINEQTCQGNCFQFCVLPRLILELACIFQEGVSEKRFFDRILDTRVDFIAFSLRFDDADRLVSYFLRRI